MAADDAGRYCGGAARSRGAAHPGGQPCPVVRLAGGADGALYFTRDPAAAAAVAGLGQSRGSQNPGDGAVVVSARHHAAVYAAERQLVEFGRGDPAHSQAPRTRRSASPQPGRDRPLVRADGTSLEPAAPTFCVNWEASTAPHKTRGPPIHQRCRSAYPAISPALPNKPRRIPKLVPNDPLG